MTALALVGAMAVVAAFGAFLLEHLLRVRKFEAEAPTAELRADVNAIREGYVREALAVAKRLEEIEAKIRTEATFGALRPPQPSQIGKVKW